MRYLLNSAVITTPGTYSYRLVTADEARDWAAAGPFISTIGYAETASALSLVLDRRVAVYRRTIQMQPGDEALVFRIVLPPGSPRIDPRDKGRILDILDAGHFELGVLTRND